MRAGDAARRAYTLCEVAMMFGLSKDSIKRRARDGAIRTILLGNRRLVPATEVDRIEREGLRRVETVVEAQ
jgi:excisionase family DNA binding protein